MSAKETLVKAIHAYGEARAIEAGAEAYPMNIEELLSRLEAATGPDQDLDIAIHKAIHLNHREVPDSRDEAFGLRQVFTDGNWDFPVPSYTASLDAALTLLDPASEYEITTLYGVARVAVDLNHNDGPHYGIREDCNVPLAMCIAALRARNGGK